MTNRSETKSPRSSRIDSYIYHENKKIVYDSFIPKLDKNDIFLNKLSCFFDILTNNDFTFSLHRMFLEDRSFLKELRVIFDIV